jgi:hypothetical protein
LDDPRQENQSIIIYEKKGPEAGPSRKMICQNIENIYVSLKDSLLKRFNVLRNLKLQKIMDFIYNLKFTDITDYIYNINYWTWTNLLITIITKYSIFIILPKNEEDKKKRIKKITTIIRLISLCFKLLVKTLFF